MPCAKCTVPIPETKWIGELSRRNPALRLRVRPSIRDRGRRIALVELSAPDTAAVLSAMRDYDAVTAVDELSEADGKTTVQLETTATLPEPPEGADVSLERPFAIQDGCAIWKIRVSKRQLIRLCERLEGRDIDASVELLDRNADETRLLTKQQRELLLAAAAKGYYDTPRNCTQGDLAEWAGIARSTCSETLHRAEERIVKRFINGCELGDGCRRSIDEDH